MADEDLFREGLDELVELAKEDDDIDRVEIMVALKDKLSDMKR